MQVLLRHHWPGNVRELKNLVERLIVRCGNAVITPADLPSEICGEVVRAAVAPPARPSVADEMHTRR